MTMASMACTFVPLPDLQGRLQHALRDGCRIGLLTARQTPASGSGMALETLMIDPAKGRLEVLESELPPGATSYPSLAPALPQLHGFERCIHDLFGVTPAGHPRLQPILLHEAWPSGYHPLCDPGVQPPDPDAPRQSYEFVTVHGDGIYEVPVGPIHAGIIEPGHFRFNCLGEVIYNLEIRLGYLHRGVEETLTRTPWRQARFVVEAISSDTTVANALAHSLALEQILGVEPPAQAVNLRAAALEMERVASHIGDLGGISGDIGFSAGASIFGRLRGAALGLLERLTGSRFGSAYILPGGVSRGSAERMRTVLIEEALRIRVEFERSAPMLMENAGALERMEGTGVVSRSVAAAIGMVGPAGRASGIPYDVRKSLRQEPYASLQWDEAAGDSGDVLSRARVRVQEIITSLGILIALLERLPDDARTPHRTDMPRDLPPNRVGAGVVEAWRGELIHLAFTDAEGKIARYAVKDPSFNNWSGLTIAVREELLSDFPLCNKSFGLSYSGNDL